MLVAVLGVLFLCSISCISMAQNTPQQYPGQGVNHPEGCHEKFGEMPLNFNHQMPGCHEGFRENPNGPQPGLRQEGNHPEGQEEFTKRLPNPPPQMLGGPEGLMENPKVKEEMKRHGEVMKGVFEKIKALHEKIRGEMKEKIKETKEKMGEKPEPPKNPDQPDKASKPMPDPEKIKQFEEEMNKLLEPYRPEAEKMAGEITTELALHHQNLAKITMSEKESITKEIAENILKPKMLRRPGMPGDPKEHGWPPENRGPGMPEKPEPPENK